MGRLYLPVLIAFTSFSLLADEVKVPVLRVGSDLYTNAVVTTQSLTRVTITHSQGVAMIKASQLDADLQRKLGYDPEKVRQAALKPVPQAATPKPAPAAASSAAQSAANSGRWFKNSTEAFDTAVREKKKVLIVYTGAGREATRMQQTLAKPEFIAYAKSHLILLEQPAGGALQQPGVVEYTTAFGDTLGYLGIGADNRDNPARGLIDAMEDANKKVKP
jgi:hypothetical protein